MAMFEVLRKEYSVRIIKIDNTFEVIRFMILNDFLFF